MSDEKPVVPLSIGTDLAGVGTIAKHLLGPLTAGLGQLTAPFLSRLANKTQI